MKVVIAHPSCDRYGADLQLLQTVSGLVQRGVVVSVLVPATGPLAADLTTLGASVSYLNFPVLTRAQASPRRAPRLLAKVGACLPRLRRALRAERPDVLLVNTITIPWWLLASRACDIGSVCHSHEAEVLASAKVRKLLTAPLKLADAIICNSQASALAITDGIPSLAPRISIIHNGVPGPLNPAVPLGADQLLRACCVSRITPHKGLHIALEALSLVKAHYPEATLEIAGTTLTDRAEYATQLRERSSWPDLVNSVRFSDYVSPVWSLFERAGVYLGPALNEPFGNATVEAGLAARARIVSGVQGHLETVTDGKTGLIVEANNPESMAAAWLKLLGDPDLAVALAHQAAIDGAHRFSPERYHNQVFEVLTNVATTR
jgi:glycosyltransferase involved in cell wall biosynthesis